MVNVTSYLWSEVTMCQFYVVTGLPTDLQVQNLAIFLQMWPSPSPATFVATFLSPYVLAVDD